MVYRQAMLVRRNQSVAARMTRGESHRHRIVTALRQCRIPDEEIPELANRIVKNVGYVGKRNIPDSFFDFETRTKTTAVLLGISQERFIEIAKKQVSLFCQLPETIDDNVTRMAELLGMEKYDFIKAAEKQPSIFGRSPETIGQHANQIRKLKQKNILDSSVDIKRIFANQLALLCLETNNFHLRYIFARRTDREGQTVGAVLNVSRATVERDLVLHYGHDPEEKIITKPSPVGCSISREERRHRALVAMVKTGIIKSYSYSPE